jgi:hypothetical protein
LQAECELPISSTVGSEMLTCLPESQGDYRKVLSNDSGLRNTSCFYSRYVLRKRLRQSRKSELTLSKVTFTLDCWSINEVALNGSSYMSPEAAASLSPQGVQQAIYGSKMTLVLEVLTLTTQWGLKGVLCLMYHRLT